jgi:uncharacterized protein YutD
MRASPSDVKRVIKIKHLSTQIIGCEKGEEEAEVNYESSFAVVLQMFVTVVADYGYSSGRLWLQ